MRTTFFKTTLFTSLLMAMTIYFSSCTMLERIGSDALMDTKASLFAETDTLQLLGKKAFAGVLEALDDPKAQATLKEIVAELGGQVDSLIQAATNKLLVDDSTSVVPKLLEQFRVGMDSLVSDVVGQDDLSAFVKQALLDLEHSVGEIRNDLLGPTTQRQLEELIVGALGDSTQQRLIEIRDSVLSARFFARINAQVDSLLTKSLSTIGDELTVTMDQAKDDINEIVILLGVVVAGLLVLSFFLFRRARKNRKINGILTYQIHNMPSQRDYDELVGRIKKRAQETGMETHLRRVLKEHGILGKECWNPEDTADPSYN